MLDGLKATNEVKTDLVGNEAARSEGRFDPSFRDFRVLSDLAHRDFRCAAALPAGLSFLNGIALQPESSL